MKIFRDDITKVGFCHNTRGWFYKVSCNNGIVKATYGPVLKIKSHKQHLKDFLLTRYDIDAEDGLIMDIKGDAFWYKTQDLKYVPVDVDEIDRITLELIDDWTVTAYRENGTVIRHYDYELFVRRVNPLTFTRIIKEVFNIEVDSEDVMFHDEGELEWAKPLEPLISAPEEDNGAFIAFIVGSVIGSILTTLAFSFFVL